MKKILFALAIALVMTACEQKLSAPTPSQVFVENNSLYGVYSNGRQAFVLNEDLHQQCLTTNTYRIQTDNQSVIVNIELSRIPTKESEQTAITFTVQGTTAIKSGQKMFQLVRTENGIIWLWNEADKMGVIVPEAINM